MTVMSKDVNNKKEDRKQGGREDTEREREKLTETDTENHLGMDE